LVGLRARAAPKSLRFDDIPGRPQGIHYVDQGAQEAAAPEFAVRDVVHAHAFLLRDRLVHGTVFDARRDKAACR
jgi:hypothetical protein